MVKKFITITFVVAAICTIILAVFYFIDRESDSNDLLEIKGKYFLYNESFINDTHLKNVIKKLSVYKIDSLIESIEYVAHDVDYKNNPTLQPGLVSVSVNEDSRSQLINYFQGITLPIKIFKNEIQFFKLRSYWQFKVKNSGQNVINNLQFTSKLSGYYSYSIKHGIKKKGKFNEVIKFKDINLTDQPLTLYIWSTSEVDSPFLNEDLEEGTSFLIENKKFPISFNNELEKPTSYTSWFIYIWAALILVITFPVLMTFFKLKIVRENAEEGNLVITKAIYGTVKSGIYITEKLQKKIVNNKLEIIANNDINGDPDVGVVKTLWVEYEYKGESYKTSVREGETLIIPMK